MFTLHPTHLICCRISNDRGEALDALRSTPSFFFGVLRDPVDSQLPGLPVAPQAHLRMATF
jgi:hypothetical protein